jgi:hypothetical protein
MSGPLARAVDTLTIRIPIWLQRRGGRKLIMAPEGAGAPEAQLRWRARHATQVLGAVKTIQAAVRGRSVPL